MRHLFLILFFSCSFLVTGFDQSTIVWSDKDQISISLITKNDTILAHDTNSFCHDRVAIVPIKILVDSYVVINLLNDNDLIICSRFQQFLTITNEWKKAIDLAAGDCLQGAESVFVQSIVVINKPIILYDLCVFPHHTFCVGKQKIVAHNFVPFIGLTISFLFGAGTAFEWSLFGGIAAAGLGFFGCAMNKNHKKKKVTVKPIIKPNQSGSGNDPDKNDDNDNERKFNVISKTVFFKKVKDKYRYDKQAGIYKKIKGKEGLRCSRTNKEIEYLRWDATHCDVEAYADKNTHLGSIRPSDGVMYRDPEPGRKI